MGPLSSIRGLRTFRCINHGAFQAYAEGSASRVTSRRVVILNKAFVETMIVSQVHQHRFQRFVVFSVTMFSFIRVLSTSFRTSILHGGRRATFRIPIPSEDKVTRTPRPTIRRIRVRGTQVFGDHGSNVIRVNGTDLSVTSVPRGPMRGISRVKRLNGGHPSIRGNVTVPTAKFVVTLIAIPVAVRLSRVSFTWPAQVRRLLSPSKEEEVAILRSTRRLFAMFRQDVSRLLNVNGHRYRQLLSRSITANFSDLGNRYYVRTIQNAGVCSVCKGSTLR